MASPFSWPVLVPSALRAPAPVNLGVRLFMPSIAKSVATLRILGDSLIPEEITAIIGSTPTSSYRKGDVKLLPGGQKIVRKSGMWLLEVRDRAPEDINAQVLEIIDNTTQDLPIWRSLCQRYEVNLFCGLFMGESNEGISLSVSTLLALGERGIEIDFDVYAPTQETK
jgi:hypothetical protein